MAVQAMKAGAMDFIEKPVGHEGLLASVRPAVDQMRDSAKLSTWPETAAKRVASLTARQRQILDLVLAGHPSKNIAADLGISQRTVDNHRGHHEEDQLEVASSTDPHGARSELTRPTLTIPLPAPPPPVEKEHQG
jgi:FixJ family two-component response regulator